MGRINRVKDNLDFGGPMPTRARQAGSHRAPAPLKRDTFRISAKRVEVYGDKSLKSAMGAAEVWFAVMEASGQDREEPVEIKIPSLSKEGQAFARDLICYFAKGFRW